MSVKLESWDTQKLGKLISLEYGSSLPETDRSIGNFPVYGSSGPVGNHETFLVSSPGIIIGRKGTVGATYWSDMPFWPIDTTYYLRPLQELHLRWCYWLLLSLPLKSLDSSTSIPGLNRNDVYELKIRVPSLSEQRRIADILDALDVQIRHTEHIITKLKLQREGLLHTLLTCGISEDGQLRTPATTASGILHKIELKSFPKAWKIFPLGKVAEIGSGVTLGRKVSGADTIELPYLRVANVQDGYLDLSEIKTVRIPTDDMPKYLLQPGDVLMTEGGDFDKLGRGTVWNGEISPCLHQNHIFRVRPDKHLLLPEFLTIISSSSYGKRFLLLSSKQSTNLASINSTQLKSFPIPCPTITEQRKILDAIHENDRNISIEEAHLNKLKLYKVGLMHDLLTGKVPVGTELEEPATISQPRR